MREDLQEWSRNDLSVFNTAESYSQILGITLSQPRNSSKGIHHISYDESCVTISTSLDLTNENTSNYYRRKIWIPYIYGVIEHLNLRFSGQLRIALKLNNLLRSNEINFDLLKTVYSFYQTLLNCTQMEIYEEFKVFLLFQRKVDINDIHESLSSLPTHFESVTKLFQIALTLLVTTCTPKRCFIAMKIFKNRLRSIVDERLNGLALMYIHKDKEIIIDTVLNRFALAKKRKINFVI